MKAAIVWFAVSLAACSRSNNLVLGRVEKTVGGHRIVVTDCYRTAVPEPEAIPGGWRWMPCRDADLRIAAGHLEVNGRPYGNIGPADAVLVDHGVVSIQGAGRGGPR